MNHISTLNTKLNCTTKFAFTIENKYVNKCSNPNLIKCGAKKGVQQPSDVTLRHNKKKKKKLIADKKILDTRKNRFL